MMEQIGVLLALLSGLAASVATIITSLKKVQQGNYRTLETRLRDVERNQQRTNILVTYLTDWQFNARQLIRLMANKLADMGVDFTPEMKAIQIRLDREPDLELPEEAS